MEALAHQIRQSSAQITALAGQMEVMSARHAVLLEEAAELARRFASEAQRADLSCALVEGGDEIQGARSASAACPGTLAANEQGASTGRPRTAMRSPLPKVKRSSPVRSDLAEEWEEC